MSRASVFELIKKISRVGLFAWILVGFLATEASAGFLVERRHVPSLEPEPQLKSQAQGSAESKALWIDLRDLESLRSKNFPELRPMLRQMERSPEYFFPDGVAFLRSGARKDAATRKNAVFGLEFYDTPVRYQGGTSDFFVVATYHADDEGLRSRKLQIRASGKSHDVVGVKVIEDVAVSEQEYQVDVSLVDRKAILTEKHSGARKVYPIDVGSFDEGVTSLSRGSTVMLTPLFKGARIERASAVESRSEPDYFRGMPFLRVQRHDGAWTPIGFHIQQGSRLARGFESHGCLRLREKDLYELYALLMSQGPSRMEINIYNDLNDPLDHPWPKQEDRYRRVKNFEKGPRKPPRIERDADDLVVVEQVLKRPPITRIAGLLNGDKLTDQELRGLGSAKELAKDWRPENWVPKDAIKRLKLRLQSRPAKLSSARF